MDVDVLPDSALAMTAHGCLISEEKTIPSSPGSADGLHLFRLKSILSAG